MPTKHRQAQVDGGRVHGVDPLLQVDLKGLVDIQPAREPDQALGKVGVDALVAYRIGIGERVARDRRPNSKVIELGVLRAQTDLDVEQALAISELREGYDCRSIRLHRGVLQPQSQALDARLCFSEPIPCALDRKSAPPSRASVTPLPRQTKNRGRLIDSMEPDAVHVAQRRGAFELNCPTATESMLSKEMIQSPIVNPRFAPPQRPEYTVGVAGCGQRTTYMVVCAEGGTGCVAVGSRNVVRQ